MTDRELKGMPERNGRRSKRVTAILAFSIGIAVGAGSTEVTHVIRERHQGAPFERRLRCRNLAEAYAKKKSNELTTIFLHRSDFSRSRNSCVAAISSASGSLWNYEVVDILTGETLFSDQCFEKGTESDPAWCGNGRDIKLQRETDRAFEKIVK